MVTIILCEKYCREFPCTLPITAEKTICDIGAKNLYIPNIEGTCKVFFIVYTTKYLNPTL
jgi:hypothetical protein